MKFWELEAVSHPAIIPKDLHVTTLILRDIRKSDIVGTFKMFLAVEEDQDEEHHNHHVEVLQHAWVNEEHIFNFYPMEQLLLHRGKVTIQPICVFL